VTTTLGLWRACPHTPYDPDRGVATGRIGSNWLDQPKPGSISRLVASLGNLREKS
jgi:hypothetical protein